MSGKNFIGIEIPSSKVDAIAKLIINDKASCENVLYNLSRKNSCGSSNIIMMVNIIFSICKADISDDHKRVEVNFLFENLFEGIYGDDILTPIINFISILLLPVLHLDLDTYNLIIQELIAVLKKHNAYKVEDWGEL